MDHIGVPIQGIQFSIARTNLTALSDENGYFTFPSSVPTGKIDLFVDGRNVQTEQAGEMIEYPALHFETAFSYILCKNGIYGKNDKIDWINISSYLVIHRLHEILLKLCSHFFYKAISIV